MEERSGVKFTEAQVALARQWIGNPYPGAEEQDKVLVTKPPTGDGLVASNQTKAETEEVRLPRTVEEACDIIVRFERGASELRSDADVADNVAQHALQDRTSLFDEQWLGSEVEEKFW